MSFYVRAYFTIQVLYNNVTTTSIDYISISHWFLIYFSATNYCSAIAPCQSSDLIDVIKTKLTSVGDRYVIAKSRRVSGKTFNLAIFTDSVLYCFMFSTSYYRMSVWILLSWIRY